MFSFKRSVSRPPRARLCVESLESRELMAAAVVNIPVSAPITSLIPITQVGQPTALNLQQADSSQLAAVVGTQPAFLSGGNASPAVPVSETLVAARQPQVLDLASIVNPRSLALLLTTSIAPSTQLLPQQQESSVAHIPDLGYFVIGTDATVEEGMLSDLPAENMQGTPGLTAPAPAAPAPSAGPEETTELRRTTPVADEALMAYYASLNDGPAEVPVEVWQQAPLANAAA